MYLFNMETREREEGQDSQDGFKRETRGGSTEAMRGTKLTQNGHNIFFFVFFFFFLL